MKKMEEENQEMRKEIEQLKQDKIKVEGEFKNKMDVSKAMPLLF